MFSYDDCRAGNIDILFEMVKNIDESSRNLNEIRKRFYRSCTQEEYPVSGANRKQRSRLILELANCNSDKDIWDKIDLSEPQKTEFIEHFNDCFGYVSVRKLLCDERKDLVLRWLSVHHMMDIAEEIFGFSDWTAIKNMPYTVDSLQRHIETLRANASHENGHYKEVYLTRTGNYSYNPPLKRGNPDYKGSRYVYRALIEILFSQEDKENFYNQKHGGRPPQKKEIQIDNFQAAPGLGVKPFFYSKQADCLRFRLPVTISGQENELPLFDGWLQKFVAIFLKSKSRTFQMKSKLRYIDYVTAKQALCLMLPGSEDGVQPQGTWMDTINYRMEDYYMKHRSQEDGPQEQCEMSVLLDIFQKNDGHDFSTITNCWETLLVHKQGTAFSQIFANYLCTALGNSLKIADYLMQNSGIADSIDKTLSEDKLQQAIIDGFRIALGENME